MAPGVLPGATALCPPMALLCPPMAGPGSPHGWARLAPGSPPSGVVFLGEGMTVAKAAGTGLIIVGVVVLNTGGAH